MRRRLRPADFTVLLDFEFCSHNYRWIDLQHVGRQLDPRDIGSEDTSRTVDLKAEPLGRRPGARRHPFWTRDWSFLTPPGLFAVAATVDLASAMERLGSDQGMVVDLEVHVSDGAVGVGLMDDRGAYLAGAETIVEGSRDTRLVTLRAMPGSTAAIMVFRNLRSDGRSKFLVNSAMLRTED